MKFIHLSDLHIGKRVNEYSMLEDQNYILKRIINIIKDQNPDAVLIAGDIYDKSIPSAEAVALCDDFIVGLAQLNKEVFIISGNHDSPERLAFGNRLMDKSGIHFSPVYNGEVRNFVSEDEYGEVGIYMLPFIRPANVRPRFPDEEINSYNDAVRTVISGMNIDTGKRNILLTHQFVTGADRTDSEDISVGGTDNIDASLFDDFDYVALGHLHRPQNIGSERIRYCGTPLKYSFSEVHDKKSVTVVELKEKGNLTVNEIPLVPKRDMVELKGKYDELTNKSFYENTTYQEDYTHITLTDENDVFDAMAKLRVIYHNIMKLDYDNTRTQSSSSISSLNRAENKSPLELFSDLYKQQNGMDMTEEQNKLLNERINKIWEEEQ